MTKEELVKYIEKEISYDASEAQKEIKCQHCGKIVQPQMLSHWIDHRSALAGNIALQLRLKVAEDIYDVLTDAYVTGDEETDAKTLADAIWSELFYEGED